MNTVVIIPSRYGSTRFAGKPLALICDKPMIQMVYESAIKAERITGVWVATDDDRIRKAVENFGGKVVMTSEDNRSGSDRVAEAAKKLGLDSNDIVVNVQGDQPLLDYRCLDDVVAPFFEENKPEMTTLSYKITDPSEISNPKDVKVVSDLAGNALYFSRSPIPCERDAGSNFDTYKHLGVYAYTRDFLELFNELPSGKLEQIEKLEQLRAIEHGYKIRVIVSEFDSPEVDLPEDIQRIEQKLK
ncbi:3-deoxy-manno-octulosonate cytidylyltransferase [Desulfobacterales bacterium HSG16]|nr:3-deoxy-manno-octulosonate cytidylyltransferase [Desulfobacterales bacterium HSG16]